MSTLGKRATLPLALSVMLALLTLWLTDAGRARAENDAVAPTTTSELADPPAATPSTAPDFEMLLREADYVSADGSYVKIGPVEISTTPVVTRAALDLSRR